MNRFAVVQHRTGALEIIELTAGSDPVDLARTRNAFLVGITSSRSRAEYILNTERARATTVPVYPR